MNPKKISLATLGLLVAVLMLRVPQTQVHAEGDGCDFALDALSTCQQSDTGNCPSGCTTNTNVASNGTKYSQNIVFTTTSGNSISDGTEDVECSAPLTCTATPHPNNVCLFGHCNNPNEGNTCYTYSQSQGNWVTAPSAKIKPCS